VSAKVSDVKRGQAPEAEDEAKARTIGRGRGRDQKDKTEIKTVSNCSRSRPGPRSEVGLRLG